MHPPAREGAWETQAGGGGIEPPFSDPKSAVLPLNYPPRAAVRIARLGTGVDSLTASMGSLIKKRRKRMRKKKHKKMLKATRWQRRAGK
jgi:hypothetical protein